MDILQKAAEILVLSGYAEHASNDGKELVWTDPDIDHVYEDVQYDQDTLEGRQQADAIEDWLDFYLDTTHWIESTRNVLMINYKSRHQWRLDRIKWCLEELCSV